MTAFSRRHFVSTAAAGTSALWLAGSRTAWAAAGPVPTEHPDIDIHERTVRDAAMTWRTLPTGWQEAPFLANGQLGAQLYAGTTANTLKLMISHSQVQDQRGQWRGGIGFSRLPSGTSP